MAALRAQRMSNIGFFSSQELRAAQDLMLLGGKRGGEVRV